jgi:hypothetical protein
MSETVVTTTPRTGSSIWRVAALLVVIGLVIVLALQLRARNATQPKSGVAPDFTFKVYPGYDGGLGKSDIKLSDLRGQVVFINLGQLVCAVPRRAACLERSGGNIATRCGVLGIDYVDTEAAALKYLQEFDDVSNGHAWARISPGITSRACRIFLVDRQAILFFKIAPMTRDRADG